MISDRKLEHALNIITDVDHEAAKARAAAEHMDDLTKTVLAKLMMQSNETSNAAKETWARMQPEYIDHLEALKACREVDYTWRNRRSAASAIIDMWRTEQSNQRVSAGVR